MRLFEAARWAPSSFNTQQWRALYARRGTEHWKTFFDLLVDANKTWAKNAAVLVVFISRKLFDHDNEPSVTHSYDCGAAWENFALQGFQQGLVVHGMQGFDYERARKELRIPDEFQVEAMAAVGKPGPKELLPEKLQARESPNDRRKLSESVFEGPFRPKHTVATDAVGDQGAYASSTKRVLLSFSSSLLRSRERAGLSTTSGP